ncbi:hypothetical protein EV560_10274 [Bosea sp. BK604]|nr:hypothetical protein EV560_10274 [Bosea sp. BK604]
MVSGKAEVVTHLGNRISLIFDMVSVDGPRRAGHLRCDTSKFEPTAFLYPLLLKCEDGTNLDIAVTNQSDRHLSFVGKIAS